MEKAKRQGEVAETIWQSGGEVYYTHGEPWGIHRTGPDTFAFFFRPAELPTRTQSCPAYLYDMLGDDFFSDVVGVSIILEDHEPKDSGMLKAVGLSIEEMHHLLESLPEIQYVALCKTRGWRYFPHPSPLDDAALKHLDKLRNLRTLNLDGASVTHSQIGYLRGLTELRTLGLTRITEEDFCELQQALPNCDIVRGSSIIAM